MVSVKEFLIAGGFSAVGLVAALLGFLKLRTVRLVRDTPLSKVGSLKPGFVKVRGKVSAGRKIRSPFSRKDCVLFKWMIKTFKGRDARSGTGHAGWQRSNDGQNGVPFKVDDGSGSVKVDPENSEAYLKLKKTYFRRGGIDAMINLMKKLKDITSNITSTADMGGIDLKKLALEPVRSDDKRLFGAVEKGDMRLNEYFVAPGDEVVVAGTARKVSDGSLKISRPGKLIISDKGVEGMAREAGQAVKAALVIGGIFFLAGIALLLKFMGVY